MTSGKRKALLIGNDKYTDPAFTSLTVPMKDVNALESVLKEPDIADFDDVRVLNNPTVSEARVEVEELFADKKKDDMLLLYFSGHGFLDSGGKFYMAFKETSHKRALSTALPGYFVKMVMDSSRSRRQVLILDCCHSGAIGRGGKGGGSPTLTKDTFDVRGYGRHILTSSSAVQKSWEGDRVIGDTDQSLFTHYLVQGLKTGDASSAPGEPVSIENLYQYVHNHVVEECSNMTPQLWGDQREGDLIIAQNPNKPEEVYQLPESLVSSLESSDRYARQGAVGEISRILKGQGEKEALAAKNALEIQLKKEENRFVYIDIKNALSYKPLPTRDSFISEYFKRRVNKTTRESRLN